MALRCSSLYRGRWLEPLEDSENVLRHDKDIYVESTET